jgi:general secretion pathway protein L
MLSEANENSGSAGFLVMLDELGPTFNANKEINISSLKYDAKNQEIRLLAVSDNFQAFEKFSSAIPPQYSIEQGALNSSKNQVSGLLTIREK